MPVRTYTMPSTYLEFSAIAGSAAMLRILPLPLAALFGEKMMLAQGRLGGRGLKYIEHQMQETFGEKYKDAQYTDMAKKFFRHLGTMLAETVRLSKLNRENIDQYVNWSWVKGEHDKVLRESGKGIIGATGHMGNWEFTGVATCLKGLITSAIARPLDNPLTDWLVVRNRTRCGQRIFTKQGALKNTLREIKSGRNVGMLVDQDGGIEGARTDFLGRPASTLIAVADLAIRSGAAIMPVGMLREDRPMHFKMYAGETIYPDKKADINEERTRILNMINKGLSGIIMEKPWQWLWTHRRWKTPNPRGFIKT